MANSNEGKFGRIYKLLSEHNFKMNVKDKFKCAKCAGILINACVFQCGCRYCRKCVDDMVTSGFEKCLGQTGDCKFENLLNIAPDHRMNMKISKLLVKCPKQLCGHECQLIEMEEHMRLCLKKPVQCPCHDMGCNDDDLVEDKINEHLQTESFNHWTMLMGLIGDLRNEVAHLRSTGNAKDEVIKVMIEEIKLLQVEKEMLKSQIDTGKDNLDRKIDAVATEINGKIESIKMEKAESSGELGDLNGKFEGIRVEFNARLDETRQGCMGHLEGQLVLINEAMGKYQENMAARMDEIKIWVGRKMDLTTFVWQVDEISTISLGYSQYFSPKINQYKIQVVIRNDEWQLQIWFRIYHGPNDGSLQWPFQAKVKVKVTNKATPGVCVDATNYCNIPHPLNNSYSSNCNEPLTFSISELSTKGLLLGDCCIVESLVDLQ